MKTFSRFRAFPLALMTLTAAPLVHVSPVQAQPYVPAYAARGAAAPSDARVEAMLRDMTLEEKIGEMTQITLQAVSSAAKTDSTTFAFDRAKLEDAIVGHNVGSILNVWDAAFSQPEWAAAITEIQDLATKGRRSRIPVLYGIDAVHGHQYMIGGTIFPQNIALAATFRPELAREAGRITAREMRASGIPWNFSPVFDLGRQPLWSRFFETFGEDVLVATRMGTATVEGMQGDDVGELGRVAACGKHFFGYSVPRTGKDRTPAWIPEHIQREYFLPPFRAAIADANLRTLMVNSGSINGVPVHGNAAILTGMLRNEIGFSGVVVTDWEDIKKLVTYHHVAATEREATKMAVDAGIDMSMVPYDLSFYDTLLSLVHDGEIEESRLDESVRRILQLKMDLGLFDDPYPVASLVPEIGSPEHQAVSRTATEQAVTLLENRGALPLARGARLLVTGPGADDLPMMHGSWTYTWQGTNAHWYPQSVNTVLEALRAKAGADHVTYVPGATLTDEINVEAAATAARASDVAVVVIGELPSAEQPGDTESIELSRSQMALAQAVIATGTPTVIVLLENRPLIVRDLVAGAAAVITAYQSGPHTGDVLADVLFGDVNPSGKLPFTYPRYSGSLETYDHTDAASASPRGFNPQWEFGHGLSYTTFETTNLRLASASADPAGTLVLSADVTNTGSRIGDEVVMAFVRDDVASLTPPVRRLRAFEKVTLAPGETRTVQLTIPVRDLAFIGLDNQPVVEAGTFTVEVGGLSAPFTVTSSWHSTN